MNTKLSALLALGVAACGTEASTPSTQPQAPAGRKAVGSFTLSVDPASGTVTVAPNGAGTSQRGIHVEADVQQDGNPNSNTLPETFQLVTTAARLPGVGGCPATDNCFDVDVDSFLTRSASQVTLVIDAVSPSRTLANGDAAPAGSGLASPYGLRTFGNIPAGGSSTREIRVTIPNLDPYTAVMTLYEQELGEPSCAAILAANPLAPSGSYRLDVDGAGALPSFNAFCDMTSQGGGWTLISNTEPIGGQNSTTAGEVFDGSHRHMPVATMQALANASSQVYMRSADNAATEFMISNTNNGVIANLRITNLLNQGLTQGAMATFFTGPMATAAILNYTCATSGNYPAGIYWACGNAAGLHLVGGHSRWTWQGGNTNNNIGMQLLVR